MYTYKYKHKYKYKKQVHQNAFSTQEFKTLLLNMVGVVRSFGEKKDQFANISPMERCKYDTSRLMSEIEKINPEFAVFKSARHVSESLRLINEFVDEVTVAYANVRVKYASGSCYADGVDIEQKAFKERFDSGTVTLARTTAWLQTTIRFALEDGFIKKDGKRITAQYVDICTLGMIYIISMDPIRRDLFPETLTHDIKNLLDIQVYIYFLVCVYTITRIYIYM